MVPPHSLSHWCSWGCSHTVVAINRVTLVSRLVANFLGTVTSVSQRVWWFQSRTFARLPRLLSCFCCTWVYHHIIRTDPSLKTSLGHLPHGARRAQLQSHAEAAMPPHVHSDCQQTAQKRMTAGNGTVPRRSLHSTILSSGILCSRGSNPRRHPRRTATRVAG